MSEIFGYYIDFDERGSFRASVRDDTERPIFRVVAGDELPPDSTGIFDDGYMRDKHDLAGLQAYLRQLRILPADGVLLDMADFEAALAARDQAATDYPTYTPEQADDIGRRILAVIGASSQDTLGSGSPASAVRAGVITEVEAAQYRHHRGFVGDQTGATITRHQWRQELKTGDEVYWDGRFSEGEGEGIYQVLSVSQARISGTDTLMAHLVDEDGNQVDCHAVEVRRVEPADREKAFCSPKI